MKILFVIDSLAQGGAERATVDLIGALRERGIDSVCVCFAQRNDGFEQEMIEAGHDLRIVARRGRIARIRGLRRIVASERPDVVHATLFESTVIAAIATWRSDAPLLCSVVNTSYAPARLADPRVDPRKLRIARAIESWALRRRANRVHAISECVARHAIEILRVPPDRVTVIRRGRDPQALGTPSASRRSQARRMLGLNANHEVVATLGRHEYQKGHRVAIEAVARLKERHPHLRLLVAGREGNTTRELQEQIQAAGIDEHVRLLGHRNDVAEVLAAADAFAFPSFYEGLGVSLVDAMALGLPIVASDIEAIREHVEPKANAILVPPGDPRALAGALDETLANRRAARSMGRRSRQIFEERYALADSVAAMVDLYRRMGAHAREQRRPMASARG